MESNYRTGRGRYRVYLVGLFLLLLGMPLWGQDAENPADSNGSVLSEENETAKPSIVLNIIPEKQVIWKRITFQYIIDHPNPLELRILDSGFPESFTYMSGPTFRRYTRKEDNGTYTNISQILYAYYSKTSGIYDIKGLKVKVGDDNITTEDFKLPIMYTDETDRDYPVKASWEVEHLECYVGQTISMNLVIHNLKEIVFQDSYWVNLSGNGIFEKLDNPGEIRSENIGSDVIYHIPVAGWLFTPSYPGNVYLQNGKIVIDGLERWTQVRPLIKVKAVPQEIKSTGAIGDFRIESWMDSQRIHSGETVSLHLKISGAGNFEYLQMPEPEYDNLTFIARDVNKDIEPTSDGFKGAVEYVYHFTTDETGSFKIKTPDFPWLSHQNGDIKVKTGRIYQVVVDEPVVEKSYPAEEYFVFMSADEVLKHQKRVYYTKAVYYLWLLPGIVVFLIFLSLSRKGVVHKLLTRVGLISVGIILTLGAADLVDPEIEKGLTVSFEMYQAEEYSLALDEIEAIEEKIGNNAALWFNKAVLYTRLEEYDLGVHALFKAAKIDPMNDKYGEALQELEAAVGLNRQIPPAAPIDPDLFYIIMLVFVNLAFILAGILLYNRKATFAIFLVFAVLFSAGSIIGIIYTHYKLHTPIGIIHGTVAEEIGRGSNMLMLPDDNATQRTFLSAGSSVSIQGENKEYYLVRTGHGLEGWVEKEDLLLF